jgi:hypothetical protein
MERCTDLRLAGRSQAFRHSYPDIAEPFDRVGDRT